MGGTRMSDRKQNNGDDSEFDRELALTSHAYKSAKPDLPPPAMDDAIRAAARRALESRPQAIGKSWISRWSAPLSAAALVVLTVSFGFIALDERPELAPAVVSDAVKPKVASTASTVATASGMRISEDSAPGAMPASPASAPPQVAAKKAQGERQNSARREQLAQSPTADVAQRGRVAAGSVAEANLAKDTNVLDAQRHPAVAAAPTYAPAPATATVSVPASASVPAAGVAPAFVADPDAGAMARKEKDAVMADSAKRHVPQEKQVSGQIAGMSVASRSDAPMPAQKVHAESQASAGVPVRPALASGSTEAAPVYAPLTDKLTDSPNAWMKRILELKLQGKTRQFEDEFAKFRKRYPDYLLPEELKEHK